MAENREANEALDGIILKRRSIRSFKPDDFPKENIEKIIRAGFAAPYTGATGIPVEQIRKFSVLKKGSAAHAKAKDMLVQNTKKGLKKLRTAVFFNAGLKKKAATFMERLRMISEKGMMTMETAPYYIVIAEKKGFPPAEKQSMAYALENMWLKATALGLGFQLLSATGTMSKNREFMDMLGLKEGEYEIEGCVIGFVDQNPPPRPEIDIKEYLKWLE